MPVTSANLLPKTIIVTNSFSRRGKWEGRRATFDGEKRSWAALLKHV